MGYEGNTGNTVNTHLRVIKMSQVLLLDFFLLLFNFITLRFTVLRVILSQNTPRF